VNRADVAQQQHVSQHTFSFFIWQYSELHRWMVYLRAQKLPSTCSLGYQWCDDEAQELCGGRWQRSYC